MTPTYPELKSSYIPGVLTTKLQLFNKREDVSYYEIGVFDSDWNPIPFVTAYKLLKMEYLSHVEFDVYLNNNDKSIAVYVCSKSKLRRDEASISSRICSKFK